MKETQFSRRKFLAYAGGALAGSALLAACGGGNAPAANPTQATSQQPSGNQSGSSQPPSSGQAVTIEAWDDIGAGPGEDALKQMNADFEKANSNYKVHRVYKQTAAGSQANEALLTAISAGTPPDAARFDRFIVPQFAAQGFLTEITDKASKDGVKKDDYFDFAWDEASYKGKVWALPWNTDTRGLWYNKDIAKEVGLDPEKPPQTVQELMNWGDKMTKKNAQGLITRYGFLPNAGQGWIYTYGWAWKGTFYDKEKNLITFSNPQVIESMKWFQDACKHVGVDNINAFVTACANSQCSGPNDYFLTGQLGMIVSGNGYVATTKKYKPDGNYGATAIPGPTGPAPYGSWSGGFSWILPKGVKQVEAGWKYISYISGPVGQATYCKAALTIPTNKKSAEDPFFREDPRHAFFMDLLKVSHARPPLPVGSLLWDEQVKARDAIMNGQKTPEQALKDVDDKVNPELKKYT